MSHLVTPRAPKYECGDVEALHFSKYEGLGNDFIVVDGAGGPDARPIGPADAMVLCDRHFSVGADGVLLAGVRGKTAFMRVLNADGSEAEMCGNGLRCVVVHLLRRGLVTGDAFTVDTAAGPHGVRIVRRGTASAIVEVEMRAPSFVPTEIPVRADAPLVDLPVDVGGRTLRITAVSMGNPHAVTFDDVSPDDRAVLGPKLERDARFPQGVNVGFARVREDGGLDLAVWERGVGFTLACGTGACAAAAAAVETGRAERGVPIDVTLPGGPLSVRIGAPGEPARMTGPARHVFDGTLSR